MTSSSIKNPKVAIIGAGCSGITALKNLLQAGISQVICFEQNDQVGGNWVYSEKISHSSVCETTHIISSKSMSQYCDFPMPDHYPDYPSHSQVLAYFQSYAKHFGLYPYIRFNTGVKKAIKTKEGKWQLQLSNEQDELFDYLIVANGHHSVPRHPSWKEDFSGEYLHSHQYKTNKPFTGKRILVVGAGNSGCDCAVEISRVAEYVGISMRTAQYIIPKFFLGKPTDSFNKSMLWLPEFIAGPLRKLSLKIQIGDYRQYGLPHPKFPVLKSHPTVNSELLYKIRHGKVNPYPGIQKISGNKVYFTSGQSVAFDTIVAATGYKISFPFFDPNFLDYSEADRVPLYLRIFHPKHQNLAFIGLVQPQGAVWPLSDYQAQLVASHITGRWQLPINIATLAELDADQISRQFLQQKRHTIEVHYHPYLNRLKRQIPKDMLQ